MSANVVILSDGAAGARDLTDATILFEANREASGVRSVATLSATSAPHI